MYDCFGKGGGMIVKRSFFAYVLVQISLSVLFGIFLTIGICVLLAPEENPNAGNAGIVLTCIFASLEGITQLVFLFLYLATPRIRVRVEDGNITVYRIRAAQSFPCSTVAYYEFRHDYRSHESWLTFELGDGRQIRAEGIERFSEEREDQFAAAMGLPLGIRRQVGKE